MSVLEHFKSIRGLYRGWAQDVDRYAFVYWVAGAEIESIALSTTHRVLADLIRKELKNHVITRGTVLKRN